MNYSSFVKLKGLEAKNCYRVEGSDTKYMGSILMYAGLPVSFLTDENQT
ncbi:GH36 C-terminal domain-containing protein [Clostridium sp. Marseille-P2415]